MDRDDYYGDEYRPNRFGEVQCVRCGATAGAFCKTANGWVCLGHLPSIGAHRAP